MTDTMTCQYCGKSFPTAPVSQSIYDPYFYHTFGHCKDSFRRTAVNLGDGNIAFANDERGLEFLLKLRERTEKEIQNISGINEVMGSEYRNERATQFIRPDRITIDNTISPFKEDVLPSMQLHADFLTYK